MIKEWALFVILNVLFWAMIYMIFAIRKKLESRHRVLYQKNTDWLSEDETMCIHIDENGFGTITISRDGEEHKYILWRDASILSVCYYEGEEWDIRVVIEEWEVSYHSNWFRVKVVRSIYFDEVTKIKFRKVKNK